MTPPPAPAPLAVVTYGLGIGGSERQLYLFLTQCDRRAWAPHVFLTSRSPRSGHWAAPIEALGIPVTRLEGGPVQKARQLRRAGRDLGVRAVLSWASCTNPYALALLGSGASRTGSFRNAPFADLPERGRRLWAAASDRSVQGVVCNSTETADFFARTGRHEVLCVPNAVEQVDDAARLRAVWRERLGVHPEELLIVGVGRLTAQKNFGRFIDAVARAAATVPARAVIVGPDLWGLGPELEREIAASGLPPGTIRLLGGVPEARELLCAADVFLLSSDHEGMPNVVLEAMAAGIPVVTTRVNGVGALLTDGVEGFVTDFDAAALADAVGRLLGDPRLRAAMGERGRQRVARAFAPEVVYPPLWAWLAEHGGGLESRRSRRVALASG